LNKIAVLNVVVFVIGWMLFVLAQAQNSIKSSTNGLQGKAGWAQWFKIHAIELAWRAFGSGLLYHYIVQTTANKLAGLGLSLESTSIAGFGGLAANSVLYQVFGLIPWLRVEVADLTPPAAPPADPKNNSASPPAVQ
jgi:hypothetical protein